MNIAIIVSGGKGKRINSAIPKQFIKINNKEMLAYTLEQFSTHPLIDEIVVVTLPEYINHVSNMPSVLNNCKKISVVAGGDTRQESVRNGINSLAEDNNNIVLIHDGDRPFVSHNLITKCIEETLNKGNCVPFVYSDDQDNSVSNCGRKIMIDSRLVNVQTPQCFFAKDIKLLHNRLKDIEFVDDASIFEYAGEDINYVVGEKNNFKITTDIDLIEMEKIVKQ